MTFQYRELENQGRVEHHICFFLEGIHPFLLAAYNRRTTCDSLLGRITTVLVISYDATQEADIGCRNPVMVVNIDGCEGGYIDFKCQTSLYIRQNDRIEGMQTFDHEH